MAKLHIKNTDGTFTPYSTIAVTNLDIVQGKGNSLTSAMSQKAVTDELGTIQDAIASIVNAGYVFAGVATPSTNPGTPEAKVFYIADGKGTYTNFGGIEVTEDEVVILYYDTEWHKVVTGIASQEKLTELDKTTYGLTNLLANVEAEANDGEYVFTKGALITPDETYSGKFVTPLGDLVSHKDYSTIKIAIQAGKHVYISGRSASSKGALAVAMSAADTVLKVYENITGETYVDYHIYTPIGTSYLLISGRPQDNGHPFCYDVTAYAYSKAETNNLVTVVCAEELTGGVDGANYVLPKQTIGSDIVLGNFGEHRVFNIPANKRVHITATNSGSYGFALTDTSNKVLEYFSSGIYGEYTFAAHPYATKLYVSLQKYLSGKTYTEVPVTEYAKELDEKIERIEQLTRWGGKTIWWCGTSIPAGSDVTIPGAEETIAGNYPKEVGNDLKANVINKAVGGSMCRANVRTGDYVGANFSNITSCLSMTKEEAEAFIANYDNIKGSLTGNPPASLSASDIARLRAASFEDRLLPYLDGTYNMPDLFVIDHGHNDFKYKLSDNSSDIGLEPTTSNIGNELAEDTFMTANNNAKLESFFGSLADIPSARKAEFIASVNRNCYIGAVNFIVTLILKYNPHARILFISNYEYEDGASIAYAPLIPAQESLAASWAFPLCKVYEYLGYSNHIIPGSKAWFNATYPAQTPVTTDITVYKSYLPDGVHPHSDITGIANNNYAGIISEFIRKIY